MKLTTKYLKRVVNEDNETEITFQIPTYQSRWLEELDKSKEYDLDIAEHKSKRSVNQNKYLWLLCTEIAKAMHDKDEWQIYLYALEKANVKYEYVLGLPIIEKELKKSFRAVKLVKYEDYKGKQMGVFKCYIGSSKMTVVEMKNLIDAVLDMASEVGLDTTYWEEKLS